MTLDEGRPSHAGRSPKQRVSVRWARPHDSHEILAFQQRVARGGGGPIVLDRTPDLFRSYTTEGATTRLLVSERPASQGIVSCAALSYKELLLNGHSRPYRVGYLGSLLTEGNGPAALQGGFELINTIPPSERPVLWLTSILANNRRALRTLASGRAFFGARYSPLGVYTTYVMRAGAIVDAIRSQPPPSSFVVSGQSQCDAILKWHGYQTSTATHHILAQPTWHSLRHEETARAVGALHDCSALKRWKIQASRRRALLYGMSLGILSVVRDYPSLSDLPRLQFLHGVAAHPDDFDAYRAMIRHLGSCAARIRGRNTPLCIGLHESNPFVSLFRRIPSLRVESFLFRVSLPHDEEFTLDSRPWHLDAGGL